MTEETSEEKTAQETVKEEKTTEALQTKQSVKIQCLSIENQR